METSEPARDLYIRALSERAKARLEQSDLVNNPMIQGWRREEIKELVTNRCKEAAKLEAQANTIATTEQKAAYQKELEERHLADL